MASPLLLKVRGSRERQERWELAEEEGRKEKKKKGKEWGGGRVVRRKACGPSGSSVTSTSYYHSFSEAVEFHNALKTVFLTGICNVTSVRLK